MARAQVPKKPATAIPSMPKSRVSIRKKWTDDWTPVDYADALSCSEGVAPLIPQATVLWRTGAIIREDWAANSSDATFDRVEPKTDWLGQYVMIENLADEGS